METKEISKIWFDSHRIFMETKNGELFSRPLEAFPILKDAEESDRLNYTINKFNDAIRWEKLDEDIHIDSFFKNEEPKINPVGEIFKRYPQINISAFAKQIGINKSLMAKYIYGIKTPSPGRLKEIQDGIQKLGKELSDLELV